MSCSKPLIAIIDWAKSPLGDPDSTVERSVIGEAAEVRRFLCESDADFTGEICSARALIIWHNTAIREAAMGRLTNCRAVIRNGAGFDSVDIVAARRHGIDVCNVPDYGTEDFHDPYLPNGADKAVGVERVRTLDELLGRCDVLSLHCPLTEETHHLIAERELALLKPGAFVVNTARGAVIKKGAILAALREGHLAGAGLDVVEDEPLRTVEEASAPNLIVTCHAAFCSVESKIEMRSTSARIALAAVLGQPLQNIVNPVG